VLARSPETMAAGAVGAGALAAVVGLAGSAGLDTPAGPSIVVTAIALLLIASALEPVLTRRRRRQAK